MPVVTERYPAVVTDNQDPDQLLRIKVACVGLLGDEETAYPEWIPPVLDWGMIQVPDIDEQVEIEIVTQTDTDEIYGQGTIEDAEIRWRGKRFYSSEAEVPTPVHEDFLDNYGKRRGFATPLGHTLVFDDTDDAPLVALSWRDADGNLSQLIFEEDGAVKIVNKDDHIIYLKDNEIEVNLSGGAALKITGKDGNAVTELGDAGVSAVIFEQLQSFWDNTFKVKCAAFDAHVHPTGVGPSGPPNPTLGCPSLSTSMQSSKLKFPSG